MATNIDLTAEEPPRPELVQLSYDEITSGADHSAAIAAAYGYGGLGILTVTSVPWLG